MLAPCFVGWPLLVALHIGVLLLGGRVGDNHFCFGHLEQCDGVMVCLVYFLKAKHLDCPDQGN